MSKITQIESALLATDPANFQRLCDQYLHRQGYDRINAIGLVIGADKVKKGTPDTLVARPDGKYVFAEYTTQQENVGAKFLKDLSKCFDESKTGIPIERIYEVVLCHTSTLAAEEVHSLVEMCRSRGCIVNIFGISQMAHDLYQKYPGLARDFLGVKVDTGQIVTPDEFVAAYNKSTLATPLDTSFHFREDLIGQAVVAMMAGNLLLVSGRAGVGKSRFALECCKEFSIVRREFKIRCIYFRGADLYEDVRVHFAEPGHYLIFVDDANRVSGFNYVLQLLYEQNAERAIKVVATVRDYALDKVTELARPFGGGNLIELPPFKDDEIKKLVEAEFGIENFHYLERIAKVSKGNPRLALMAARVAVHEDTIESISDVSALYDEYFRSVRQDLSEFGDSSVLQTIGVIAFFRAVDRTNDAQMHAIKESFGLSADAFWLSVRRLHELEVVDLYEDEIVRVSDQVLATYLFYLVFFKERVLDPAILLTYYFPSQRRRIFDILNPVVNAFDAHGIEKQLRPIVVERWRMLDESGDLQKLIEFVDAFCPFDKTAALRFVRDRIGGMSVERVDASAFVFKVSSSFPSPSLFSVLGTLVRSGDLAVIRLAVELLVALVAKSPTGLPHALYLLREHCGIKATSHLRNFDVQDAVVNVLWARIPKEGEQLFLARMFLVVVEPLLHTHVTVVEAKGEREFYHIQFDVPITPEIRALRCNIWRKVFSLYPALDKRVIGFLQKHARVGYQVNNPDLLASDAAEVLPLIDSVLDSGCYMHCVAVHAYLDRLSRSGVVFDVMLGTLCAHLRSRFTSETFRVAEFLINGLDNLRERVDLGGEEYQRMKTERIRAYFDGYGIAEYDAFFARCTEIYEALLDSAAFSVEDIESRDIRPSHNERRLCLGIVGVIDVLAEYDPSLFRRVVERYLESGNPLKLEPYGIVHKFVASCGADQAYGVLTAYDFHLCKQWLFAFFVALPPEAITVAHVEQLCLLYRESGAEDLFRDMDYLLRFSAVDPEVIQRITAMLVEKAQQDPRFGLVLGGSINAGSAVGSAIREIFSSDVALLKQAYFAACRAARYADYDSKVFSMILDLDVGFFAEWVDWLCETEGRSAQDGEQDYTALWLRDDYSAVIGRTLERLFLKGKEHSWAFLPYAQAFFQSKDGGSESKSVRERQDSLLHELIEARALDAEFMTFLFGVIQDLESMRRRLFVEAFVARNQSVKDFKRLSLEPNHWSWSGSAVPLLQERIGFYSSLLPALNTIELLEHKYIVEQKIGELQKQVEREKRRDFVDET